MLRFSELMEKEVISCIDGSRLGFVDDLFIEQETGRITGLIVPECSHSPFQFKRGEEHCVDWCDIEKMGEDVILVRKKKINVQECDRVKLEFLTGSQNHQGVAAYLKQKEYCTVDDILACARERGEPPLIVVADEIADPHNLGAIIRTADACGAGAIIRTADACGAHGVIIPRHRGVGVTPAVSKSSAGAVVHVNIAKVTNLSQTLGQMGPHRTVCSMWILPVPPPL